MSQPRIINADFATWRPVQGRKVLQLIFEAPLEATESIMKVLGVPQPGESKWCEIRLLQPEPQAKAKPEAAPHKSFAELTPIQQAGIRCADPIFQEFLKLETEEAAADQVRRWCGVKSRSEITLGSEAGDIWRRVEAQYQSWLTDRKFAEAKR